MTPAQLTYCYDKGLKFYWIRFLAASSGFPNIFPIHDSACNFFNIICGIGNIENAADIVNFLFFTYSWCFLSSFLVKLCKGLVISLLVSFKYCSDCISLTLRCSYFLRTTTIDFTCSLNICRHFLYYLTSLMIILLSPLVVI